MSGWQFHLFALPLFVTSAIAAVFAAVLWRRRSQYGALTLMVLMIAAGVWTLSEAAELGCQTVEGRYFWSCVRHLGIAVIPSSHFSSRWDATAACPGISKHSPSSPS